ncbi:putative inactive purple acid phosphatase 16 [Camellia lanceoleosa]|uniref:Inactive purple acid phosphatase 16 n=1 Tax=Camellia lanceoleosa TaxID=1840588 RepID=A0ACC0GXF8_9ERIC|nr:putative inactive purple acid phosphatase 16 [Camellia lanceoleosa]
MGRQCASLSTKSSQMAGTRTQLNRTNSAPETSPPYARFRDLKTFDESKAGVKGLVDAGIEKIPRIFVRPPTNSPETTQFRTPIFQSCHKPRIRLQPSIYDRRRVRRALETLGFFGGEPRDTRSVLEEMLRAARGFNEQNKEVKMGFYSRELERRVKFGSNFDLYHQDLLIGETPCYVLWVPTLSTHKSCPRFAGEPVISYRGGVDGFEATARILDEKIDVTSFRGTRRLELMRNEIAHNTLSYSRAGPKELWPSISNYVLQLSSSNDSKSPVAFLYFIDSGGGTYPEVVSRSQADSKENPISLTLIQGRGKK